MKFKNLLLVVFLLNHLTSFAQDNVIAFYEYDIKSGMTDQFINGYEKDLEWHQSQADDWSWVGWFVMNGNRRTRFIDATPNHSWRDFDNWKVNNAENSRHNKIHWVPYVENLSGSYKILLDEFSDYQNNWYTRKFLQTYQIKIKNGKANEFKLFLSEFKEFLQKKLSNISFIWMKTISGGEVNEYQLFIALNKIEDFKQLEDLFEIPSNEKEMLLNYTNSMLLNVSELWIYSEKLSLINEKK